MYAGFVKKRRDEGRKLVQIVLGVEALATPFTVVVRDVTTDRQPSLPFREVNDLIGS
jgi:hypothetical protein